MRLTIFPFCLDIYVQLKNKIKRIKNKRSIREIYNLNNNGKIKLHLNREVYNDITLFAFFNQNFQF